MGSKVLVEVSGLKKKYDLIPVVKGIDFDILEGEVLGLLGPNGAGKTTTILMLTTYLKADGGNIKIDSESMNDTNKIKSIQSKIGYVPQEISLYGELNAAENLEFFGKLYGVKGNLLKTRVSEALKLVGLEKRKNQPVKQFSGGMQRRLNIAAALIHKPKLVILDEPTVGIDPQSRNQIFNIVKELKRHKTSIIYVTHYMEEAQTLCDKVAIMDEGKIIAMDTVKGLLEHMAGCQILSIQIDNWDKDNNVRLKKEYGAKRVTYANGILSIYIKDVKEMVPILISDLYTKGYKIKKIEMVEPNLQEIFLELTGKKLRD